MWPNILFILFVFFKAAAFQTLSKGAWKRIRPPREEDVLSRPAYNGTNRLFHHRSMVYMKREDAGNWNSGLKVEQSWDTYFVQLQTPWKSARIFFPIYQKYWTEEELEGHQGVATSLHDAATPQAAPWGLVGTLLAHLPPSFSIWRVSSRKKWRRSFFVVSPLPRGGTWAEPI